MSRPLVTPCEMCTRCTVGTGLDKLGTAARLELELSIPHTTTPPPCCRDRWGCVVFLNHLRFWRDSAWSAQPPVRDIAGYLHHFHRGWGGRRGWRRRWRRRWGFQKSE